MCEICQCVTNRLQKKKNLKSSPFCRLLLLLFLFLFERERLDWEVCALNDKRARLYSLFRVVTKKKEAKQTNATRRTNTVDKSCFLVDCVHVSGNDA